MTYYLLIPNSRVVTTKYLGNKVVDGLYYEATLYLETRPLFKSRPLKFIAELEMLGFAKWRS